MSFLNAPTSKTNNPGGSSSVGVLLCFYSTLLSQEGASTCTKYPRGVPFLLDPDEKTTTAFYAFSA